MIRKQFIATGKVQGVGFRFFTKISANSFNITGKVENLIDGSLLIEAQGSEENIQNFTKKLFIGNGFCKLENLKSTNLSIVLSENAFKIT